MNQFLTIDLGTTYFKVCLFSSQLELLALERVATPITRPAAGRVEISADSFTRRLTGAICELGRQVGGLDHVAAVCFASQANTFALVDDADKFLTPFVVWSDERARRMPNPLGVAGGSPEYARATGMTQLDFLFLPFKYAWLRRHQPDLVVRARRVVLLSDHLTHWMSGAWCSEAGLAGFTGLVDIRCSRWLPDACTEIGLPLERLPPIVRAGEDAGKIRPQLAAELGLPTACRFVIGCLDQYAGAVGTGNVAPGTLTETTGTVLATVRCSDQLEPSAPAGVYQGPACVPGRYYQLAFSNVAAGLLEKVRETLPGRPSYAELDRLAATVPAGCDGLQLDLPPTRAAAAPVFAGESPHHTAAHRIRAVMEGVAMELKHQLGLLCGDAKPTQIRCVGGAAKSSLWLQIKAQQLGLPVAAVDCPEPTSLGAALLAKSALTNTPLDHLVCRHVRTRSVSPI